MTTIYIVNSAGHNFSEAERFGQVEVLTEGKVNIFSTERIKGELEEGLRNVGKDDYLLLSGNVVLNVLAALIMKEKTGVINMLIYDAARKTYVPREME